MGVVLSDQRKGPDSLFVTAELRECAPKLATNPAMMDDFVRYIKDGGWIDLLAESEFLNMHASTAKRRSIPVTFYSNALPASAIHTKVMRQGSVSVHSTSLRSSSVSTRDSYQSSVENFTDFYTNLEERTCFTPDQMVAFLIAVVYSLFSQTGERPAMFQRDASVNLEDCATVVQSPDVSKDVALLQEMLLAAAAFYDEQHLHEKLASQDWLRTLDEAVNDCPLNVCICEVVPNESSGGGAPHLHPVLINNVARKRIHTLNRSQKHKELDFLQLWSIESEELLQTELNRSLRCASPVQLHSVHAINHTRTVLDVSHIFDSEGQHRYVLGVQMDVPEDGKSAKHLQYLHDTALVIGRIMHCGQRAAPIVTATTTASFSK